MHGALPNKNGPFDASRHSRQMVAIRSISAWAPAHTLKPGKCALMFIGSAERRLAKPECISPEIERDAFGLRQSALRAADEHQGEIGRAHVCTPVTPTSRMPASACSIE